MDVNGWMVWVVLALGVASAGLLVWLVVMALRAQSGGVAAQGLLKELQDLRAQMQQGSERLERELRREVAESSQGARQELTHTLATFQQSLTQQGAEATRTQNTQIDAFGQQLALLQKTLSDTLNLQLSGLSESNARRWPARAPRSRRARRWSPPTRR